MVAAVAEQEIRLRTEIWGPAARLFDNPTGEIIISGPRGTGKTRAILEWIHWRCQRERLRVLFLRKTLESLKTSALVTYQEQVLYTFDGKRSVEDGVRYFGGSKLLPAQFTYEQTGSVIILGGMDSPSRVLSTEYDIIYPNEAIELTLDQWERLTGSTDRPRLGAQRPPSIVVGDCNPDAPTHWIKVRAADGKLQLWPTTHRDNPAMWDRERQCWTEAGKRYLARLRTLTGLRRQRFLLGLWVAAEGQVLDAWRDDVHIVDREDVAEPLKHAWYFGTADWGYTNAGVLHVHAMDRDNRMYLVAELYMTRRPVEGWWVQRATELSKRFGFRRWDCDPSEPAFIQCFRDAGLDAQPAVNDILPGITAMQARLAVAGDGRPRLFMLRDCLLERDEDLVADKRPFSTVQEIPEYVWAKNAGGQSLKDKPVDANNHGIDAWRYGVAGVDLRGRTALVAPGSVSGGTVFGSGSLGGPGVSAGSGDWWG